MEEALTTDEKIDYIYVMLRRFEPMLNRVDAVEKAKGRRAKFGALTGKGE